MPKAVLKPWRTTTHLLKPLLRHLGNLEPRMLSRRTYLDARRPEGVSDGTIRREIGVLRAALHWAIKEKWIEAAPFVDSAPMPPPRERWLSEEEMDRLLDAARAAHLRLFILLGYHTAARAGAILDLTWDRVDFVRRQISYERHDRPKSRKRRASVRMNAELLAEMQTARDHASGNHVIEWRGRPIGNITRAFAEACQRAGIEDCSPHVLRHTAATRMAERGVPLAEIARMLGDTEAMVERVYAKHGPDYLSRAADALMRKPGLKLLRSPQKKG